VAQQNGLEIQILVHRAQAELDQRLAVVTEQQDAIPQHGVPQSWRGLVENEHVHFPQQQPAQPTDEFQARVKAAPGCGTTCEQHSDVHIALCPGPSLRLRTEKERQRYLGHGREVAFQGTGMVAQPESIHSQYDNTKWDEPPICLRWLARLSH